MVISSLRDGHLCSPSERAGGGAFGLWSCRLFSRCSGGKRVEWKDVSGKKFFASSATLIAGRLQVRSAQRDEVDNSPHVSGQGRLPMNHQKQNELYKTLLPPRYLMPLHKTKTFQTPDAAIQPSSRTIITSAATPEVLNCNESRLDRRAGYFFCYNPRPRV